MLDLVRLGAEEICFVGAGEAGVSAHFGDRLLKYLFAESVRPTQSRHQQITRACRLLAVGPQKWRTWARLRRAALRHS